MSTKLVSYSIPEWAGSQYWSDQNVKPKYRKKVEEKMEANEEVLATAVENQIVDFLAEFNTEEEKVKGSRPPNFRIPSTKEAFAWDVCHQRHAFTMECPYPYIYDSTALKM